MPLSRVTTANARSTWAVLCFVLGLTWLGLTTAQGLPMRPVRHGPPNLGQRRGYGPPEQPRPRPMQPGRRYQMSGYPLPSVQQPFGPPAEPPQDPQQASLRCHPQDASRQGGTWSSEGGDTLSQATGVNHGSQGGFYPPSSSFASGQLGPQKGSLPAWHPGQGSGVILSSTSYGSYDPWVSPSGQRPSGAEGVFDPRPGTGGHEEWSPLSGSSARPFRPPARGGQEGQWSEYGPGTPTGYDQRPQGGRPAVQLLGTGPSGQWSQSRPTGDRGYPSPSSGEYGFDLANGQNPPFFTPRTLTEDRLPEVEARGPG